MTYSTNLKGTLQTAVDPGPHPSEIADRCLSRRIHCTLPSWRHPARSSVLFGLTSSRLPQVYFRRPAFHHYQPPLVFHPQRLQVRYWYKSYSICLFLSFIFKLIIVHTLVKFYKWFISLSSFQKLTLFHVQVKIFFLILLVLL